uniref:Ig-like domain-containing protein n=1 Tax=Periophthalmus magnuspinnatus TaxID=409849 RepID=A0A3B4BLB4_9GOBI
MTICLALIFTGNMMSRGWSFSAPSSVSGMAGSCVTVPCTFTYSQSQPADLKVIWYLYGSKGYTPVYGPSQEVVSKYSTRTSLIGSVNDGNCTLKIDRLEMSHSQDRVYLWVDKNPITSYHTMGHSFYDKTTQIISITVNCFIPGPLYPLSITSVTEEFLEGVLTKVTCTASYTCAQNKPILTWNYDNMEATSRTSSSGKAQWKTISTLNFISAAKDHGESLTCYAHFTGGQGQNASISLRVKSKLQQPIMIPPILHIIIRIRSLFRCYHYIPQP